VLLVEQRDEVATALTTALERRGMQVARASDGRDAAAKAFRVRPNLVVMDLMREAGAGRAGIVGWLRSSGQLGRTPLAAYTLADMRRADLDLLGTGRTVPYLVTRSTDTGVRSRILEVLNQISGG
jgi:DNA-binding response OmpR family regulator